MLGNIPVRRDDLCTLCHALREAGGLPDTLLTHSDTAVFTILLSRLNPTRARAQAGCSLVPWRRVELLRLPPAQRRASAALATSLAATKLQDEADDEGRLSARLGTRLLRSRAARARRELESLGFGVGELDRLMPEQRRLEADPRSSLEQLEAPTARLVSQVLSFAARLARRPELEQPMALAGEHLGRLVYLWDAMLDRQRDRRRGRFNALDQTGTAPGRATRRLWSHLDAFQRSLPEQLEADDLVGLLRSRIGARRGRWSRPQRLARAGMLLLCCVADEQQTEADAQAAREKFLARRKTSLECPRCHDYMETIEVGQVHLDSCASCAGFWFDDQELERLTLLPQVPEEVLDRKGALWKRRGMPPGSRRCPRCRELLKVLQAGTATIDVCPGCKGCWVDQKEVRRLLAVARPTTYTCSFCGTENKDRKTCRACGAPYREAVD